LRRVHAPIGLDIGSETVPEIALSIAAELVKVRRSRSQAEPSSTKRNPSSLRDMVRPLDPVRRTAQPKA
jgi:xanthine/CO dehydrogenase XdhC/CoxF family maturation factor